MVYLDFTLLVAPSSVTAIAYFLSNLVIKFNIGSVWDHLQNKSDPKVQLFELDFRAILKNVDSERRWPTRWKLHSGILQKSPKSDRLKYRRFSGVPFMPVVKSIVSKNELHATQKEVIPVGREVTVDYIMYVQSQLKSEFIERWRSLDLEPIIFLLTHPKKSLGWSRDKALQAIAHYKMFLLLHYLYPDKNIVPTKEIDEVLHQHSSDSVKYHQDCNHLFGYFLHHDPYFGLLDEADEKSHLAAFMETKVLFKKHFGIDLSNNPSRCQPLKQPKPIHPRVANIQPWNLMKCA